MSKTINCSFCGRSEKAAGKMMASSDRAEQHSQIRICLDCAKMAVGILERMDAEKKSKRRKRAKGGKGNE